MGYITRTNKGTGFYQLPEAGLGYYLGRKEAGRVWGQPFLILFLLELGERWFSLRGNSPFGVGDLAEEDGREIRDHNSHRFGSAVDLYIFHKNGLRRNDFLNQVSCLDKTTYDQDTTLEFVKLIKNFSARYVMQQILFNDNQVNQEVNKVGGHPPVTDDSKTKQSQGQHYDHIHITFNGKSPYSPKQIVEILENKKSPFASPHKCNLY
ncbi:MAG: penicillin-insensitive murein endopeptidase [Pyrinomonadaceae bacterium]